MEQDGQADSGPETIDDLAQFLVDNPEETTEPKDKEEDQNSEESEEDNSEEQDQSAEDDDEEESSADKQATGLKFKVPVKGDDGSDTTIEVDEKELIAGYQRHADYTRKTMELGDKEREITRAVSAKLEEGRNHYLQQAQMARAAVLQLAGLKTAQEMAVLAQTDPGVWVQEKQREQVIHGFLAQIEQGMGQEQEKAEKEREAQKAQEIARTWGVLGSHGINREKLVGIYETINKKYGVPAEKLASVVDSSLVLILRDAAAYQGLKDKKGEVTKKASSAEKLPGQRQSVPRQEQITKKVNDRFRNGKAKLDDLAALIQLKGI